MFTFATDYCITVFISALGVLQLAFSVGGLKGLLVFKSAIVARTLGLTLAIVGFVLFFSTGTRNINDYEGGLDAPTQALFFFYGSLAAVLATLALTSIINHRMRGPEAEPEAGIDSLRDTNYALSLARSVRYWWKFCQKR